MSSLGAEVDQEGLKPLLFLLLRGCFFFECLDLRFYWAISFVRCTCSVDRSEMQELILLSNQRITKYSRDDGL